MVLTRDFYLQDTVRVAKTLLGKLISCQTTQGLAVGRIVETEAYLGKADPASHSFRGLTPRNQAMFGLGGHAYIYFTYGMHFCFNVVTKPKGEAEAVLIRALEPIQGLDLMAQRRGLNNPKNLCSGPAKLVQALGITKQMNGSSLITGSIKIHTEDDFNQTKPDFKIVATTRIGITQAADKKLRFYVKNSPFVSKK